MILPQQLFTCVFTDLTKLIIGISDITFHIGDTNDGMLIKRNIFILTFTQSFLQIFLHDRCIT